VAYLFVLNSLIFRIPLPLKRVYAPLLTAIESVVHPYLTKRLSCIMVGQWRKKLVAPAPATPETP